MDNLNQKYQIDTSYLMIYTIHGRQTYNVTCMKEGRRSRSADFDLLPVPFVNSGCLWDINLTAFASLVLFFAKRTRPKVMWQGPTHEKKAQNRITIVWRNKSKNTGLPSWSRERFWACPVRGNRRGRFPSCWAVYHTGSVASCSTNSSCRN